MATFSLQQKISQTIAQHRNHWKLYLLLALILTLPLPYLYSQINMVDTHWSKQSTNFYIIMMLLFYSRLSISFLQGVLACHIDHTPFKESILTGLKALPKLIALIFLGSLTYIVLAIGIFFLFFIYSGILSLPLFSPVLVVFLAIFLLIPVYVDTRFWSAAPHILIDKDMPIKSVKRSFQKTSTRFFTLFIITALALLTIDVIPRALLARALYLKIDLIYLYPVALLWFTLIYTFLATLKAFIHFDLSPPSKEDHEKRQPASS
ncbi:hypothetical protein ACQZV8_08550 [Magnetococcales bacterium HHB-1]